MAVNWARIPDWLSQENQGAGVAVSDLAGTGRKDLLVLRVDSPPGKNEGFYRVGKDLGGAGSVAGGWGSWLPIPGWFSHENQGAGIAVGDLSGSGHPDLVVFMIDNPATRNGGYYRVGKALDADGNVTGGWSDWHQVPDWFSWQNQHGGITLADLSGNGRLDLVVFMIDNPAEQNTGYYRIGRDLDADGNAAGGWTGWQPVPNWFSWENQGAGVAITGAQGDAQRDLVVVQVDAPEKQNQAFFRIGRDLRADGQVHGRWSPWYGVPAWFSWENQGASIAVADLRGDGTHALVVLMVDHRQDGNQALYQALPLDNDPRTQGRWELLPYESEVLPVHAAVLNTGRVLFAAGSGNSGVRFNDPRFGDTSQKFWCSVVWDPAADTPGARFFHPDTLRRDGRVIDFFCGGETLLADGRVLTAGGTRTYDVDAQGNPVPILLRFTGRPDTLAFSPQTSQWEPMADMADGRWYPTLVTLADGRVLAAAGLGKIGLPTRSLEVFTPDGGTGHWRPLPLPSEAEFKRLPLYPHLFLMVDGRIFFTGGRMDDADVSQSPALLDVRQNPIRVQNIGGLQEAHSRNQSASVLLPPAQDQRVMILGGAPIGEQNATDAVDVVDVKMNGNPPPEYRAVARLLLPRVHANAVLLPDRTVFVSGGALQREGGSAHGTTARFEAEIYDPERDEWILGATAQIARMYHSVALLLPDGRVVAAGGNPEKGRHAEWGKDENEEMHLEIYSPPYLFRKDSRPEIGGVATAWQYGQTITIPTAQAGAIRWASLIRNGVTTHSFNTSQRLVDLPIQSQGGGNITVTVASDPNIAPPGDYMLFLTDNEGVPSVARWIRLT